MTRFARLKREQRVQVSYPTPWNELSATAASAAEKKEAFLEHQSLSFADDSSVKQPVENVPQKEKFAAGKVSKKRNPLEIDSENPKALKKIKRKAKQLHIEEESPSQPSVYQNATSSVGERQLKTVEYGKQSIFLDEGKKNRTKEFSAKSVESELIKVQDLGKVKEIVGEMMREGKIDVSEGGQLIRRWRTHNRQAARKSAKNAALKELSSALDSGEQTLDDVKRLVNSYVAKKLVSHFDAGQFIKKWKSTEKRRVGRQLKKANKACCFFCRQSGHQFSECPERDENSMGTGICFKCGSMEHTSVKCPRKHVRGYPYAVCFVCKQKGHLSRDCERNSNGIYPDGGSCNLCGSQKHLKRDCPELQQSRDLATKKELLASMGGSMVAGDEDVPMEDIKILNKNHTKKLKQKVIRF